MPRSNPNDFGDVQQGCSIPLNFARSSHERNYSIQIGRGILRTIGSEIASRNISRVVIIADEAVALSHSLTCEKSFLDAGVETSVIRVPSGEQSKSIQQVEQLWIALASLNVDRRTAIIAVGGGVVGDLAGFVAATFSRGLTVWQVPTTLVAQVDSAVGGKTGINLPCGKNLVGAFWQPSGVIVDIHALDTLPSREYGSGLAEVVKYGMILDPTFFSWLESHCNKIRLRDPDAVEHIVSTCCRLKVHVVEQDEREETGLRVILNYGHTFAHAIETASGYGVLLHGEAVSIGMVMAARLAERLGMIDADICSRQEFLLTSFDLPVTSAAFDPDILLDIMARDKKSVAGRLRFVLPECIGKVRLVDSIDHNIVKEVLTASSR